MAINPRSIRSPILMNERMRSNLRRIEQRCNCLFYFVWLGVTACFKLGVDQRIIGGNFKAPAFGGQQANFFQAIGKLFKQRVRQTDGTRSIVSLHAKFDGDDHCNTS